MSLLKDNQPTDLEQMVGLSRRGFISAGALCGAAMFLGGNLLSRSVLAASVSAGTSQLLGFDSIPAATSDAITLPPGYKSSVLISWGQPLQKNGPAFDPSGNGTAEHQEVQFGDNNDGMSLFEFPGEKDRALMAINNEYTNYRYLYPHGGSPTSLEEVRKALASEGVSVIEVRRKGDTWQFVQDSRYNRRIHGNSPIRLSGPAAGHDWLKTSADKSGKKALGTFQNCANGKTPWGTYLTCEENFTDCFGSTDPNQTFDAAQKRYGVVAASKDINWHLHDPRFDMAKHPNELNRHGWVVEIDPFDPKSTPRKHTALGRFKHEGAKVTIAPDGRLVVYMGDDQRFEYIYKFVSKNRYQPGNRAANMRLLEEGTLYVARFNENGSGDWLALVHGQNGLTAANGFADQGEVLVKTRMAADLVGATKMDRPEWITADPFTAGSIYCTLTNNSQRGQEGKPAADAANPRANNLFGHIIHWQEADGDGTKLSFKWDILVLAGNKQAAKPEHKGNINGDDFGSPDGLAFDNRGVLWIQTDVSTSTLNMKEYAGMGNNQMVATVLGSNEYRRFLTAPNGSEVTGIAFTPDNKTMFINIQHPGEPSKGDSDPAHPTAVSAWPDGAAAGRPRAATVVITKNDGGVIGS